MKRLALLLFVGLVSETILACDAATPERTTETSRRAGDTDRTQVASVPTATSLPTNTPASAAASQPTEEPAPTAAHRHACCANGCGCPPSRQYRRLRPHLSPPPLRVPAPTATLVPTSRPALAPTAVSQSVISSALAPLGDNLRFVAYLDRATQRWLIFDATGNFKPEDLPLTPQMETPDASDIEILTELEPRGIYTFVVNENHTVELGGISYTFYKGSNLMVWK